jgi:hypothetical protein
LIGAIAVILPLVIESIALSLYFLIVLDIFIGTLHVRGVDPAVRARRC